MNTSYAKTEPSRAEVDRLDTPALIEFGTPWCGYCQAAQTLITSALEDYPGIRHFKIEDGSGRPLGRSFGVKLWPTLIFLNQGLEVARLVRPRAAADIRTALQRIAS